MPNTVPIHEKNFAKELVVPPQLVGCKALKWEEGGLTVTPVTISVDPNCFFFLWTDQHRKSDCLELSAIRDTRIGDKKAKLPRDPKLQQLCLIGNATDREIPLEEKCMTIVCGSSLVELRYISFIFAKRSEAHFWTTELFQLAYNYKTQNLSLERTLLKIYTKLKITLSPEVRISVKDIVQYFYADKDDRRRCERVLESHRNDPILLEKFQFKDFLRIYSQIVPRPDLEHVFNFFCTKNVQYMTVEQVKDFLNRSQRDPRLNEILHPHASNETARALIEKYEPHESFRHDNRLSQEGFIRFLISDSNAIISSSSFTLHQDMTQPLSHYLINSSHNTYLLGAQIKGKSSAEMYRQALLSGCRCVELDCWDGEDGEPIITHGRTLTIPIGIKEALDAIADYAFKTSDFPVILSLENRCSARLQDKLAKYLKRAFGGSLLDKPLPQHPLESGTHLPSPELLKNRVLVKNKKKAPTVGSSVNFLSPSGEPRITPEDSHANDSDTDDESDDVVPESLPPTSETASTPNPVASMVVPMVETELSALVVYVQPTRFDSFDAARKRNRGYECVSLNEDRAMMHLKKDPVHFIDFNKRQLTRIYPNGTRVKSTNFLPFFFWSAGCQMVALNVQTPDLGMQLNTMVFEFNGRSGYVLKPELMRRKDRTLDPFMETPLDGVVPASLSVRIISGLMLSFKKISTYVEVDMYGIFGDIDKKNHKTKSIMNSGMNPQYEQHGQPFLFRVTLPEMAYLRISVREMPTSRFIGHCLLPVTQIRPGYRHVVLQNEIAQTLSATLFIFVEVKDYIPSFQMDLANALENPIRAQTEHDRKAKLSQIMDNLEDHEQFVDDMERPNHDDLQSLDRSSPVPIQRHPLHTPNGVRTPDSLGNHASLPLPRQSSAEKHTTTPTSENRRESGSPASLPHGTPKDKRGSVQPERVVDPDDLAAQQRLQSVHAPNIEDLKKNTKALQNTCAKQDRGLKKLQMEYTQGAKRLEKQHAKEREKLALEQEKVRAVSEKRKMKGSNTTLSSTSSTGVMDIDNLIKSQETQRWTLLRKQAECLADLQKEHYAKEHELNKKFHEVFYQMLENELHLQQEILNAQLVTISGLNVNEMTRKQSQQASKELRELKDKGLDKIQLEQSRDDLTRKNIQLGVAIGKKYETLFEDRKKTFAEEMDMLLQQVQREKHQVMQDLEAKHLEKCGRLEEELRKNSAPARMSGGGDAGHSLSAPVPS